MRVCGLWTWVTQIGARGQKLIGANMLMNLSPNTMLQGSLFDCSRLREETAKVMAVLDALNRRYGRDTLVLSSAGTGGRWAMKAENRTPRYTTSWSDLPRAHAK